MYRLVSRALSVAGIVAAVACGGGDRDQSAAGGAASSGGSVDLTGAGATFPYPLYSKWISDYNAKTGVRINYQSIGSGGGIRQLSEGTVDFGASDAPMTEEEQAKARGPVLHIPTVIGAVVITYNVPEITQPLRLDGPTIADIFLGKIAKWNDSRIAALNPGVTLPANDILVVHRSDGSGTTFIFSDYLSAVSPAWAAGPGRGKELKWPVGLGAKGNEGVAGQVKQTPNTIGYTELAYVVQNRLPAAHIRNAEGNFVEPTTESITAAAASVTETLPADSDFRISIVNAPGAASYPIASFTWLLVYAAPTDTVKAAKLGDFIRWALTEGQSSAAALHYAPLPPALVARVTERLAAARGVTAQ